MKEVYKGNEIIESFHQDHLFKYHNWLLKAAKQYSSIYESHNELKYDHIVISSLTSIEDGKISIKENFHRDNWIKYDRGTYFAGRVSKGFILMHRASFEIAAYDEKCIWSDKTGIKYKDDFYFDIAHVRDEEEDNEFKFLQETKDLDVELCMYLAERKKLHEDELYEVPFFEMSQSSRPELTREEYEAEHYQQQEDEKNERIESWEEFEDEIY